MLAIIPARGGSIRLPRKNILPLCGRPMIAYVIDAALGAKRVDRVVVSTEDEEIAEIAPKREQKCRSCVRPSSPSTRFLQASHVFTPLSDGITVCRTERRDLAPAPLHA